MRTLRPILLALTALAALSVAYPAKANLITNPGFETGDFPPGWTATGNVGVVGTVNSVAPHSGNFQAFFISGSITQNVTTTPGVSYVVDFWLAGASGTGFNSSFSVLWGGSTIFSHVFTSAFGYTEFTFNVTASSATTALEFDGSVPPGLGVFVLDDVSVIPAVPDGGTTVSLLGCALLGLAALRRKLGC